MTRSGRRAVHWYGGLSIYDKGGGLTVYPAGTGPCGRRGLWTTHPEDVSCEKCAWLLSRAVQAADALRQAAEPHLAAPERLSSTLDARALLDAQPDPVRGTGDVWAAIIEQTTDERLLALYRARREQGIERYGVPLQADNGRDHLADALAEVVDAVCYLAAAGYRGSVLAERVEAIVLDVLREIEVRDA